MYVNNACTLAQGGRRMVSVSLELELHRTVNPIWCLELSFDPLQEQQVLLNPELSLQPLVQGIWLSLYSIRNHLPV